MFAAGFGAMNLFWRFGTWRRDVPGLWDYRSATIGDGILLPIAAGLLVTAGDQLRPASGEMRAVSAATVTGVLVAAVLQWVALRDNNPQPNWTLPAPHTLNIAGWYHAALLVVASGFFAAFAMRVVWRARAYRAVSPESVEKLLASPGATVLIACLVGFVGLLLLDMYPIRGTETGVAMIGGSLVGLVGSIGVLAWGFGWGTARTWFHVSLGVVLAVILCMLAR
jgi:hypothetical protein